MIRLARQTDSAAVVDLVDRVYREYGEQIYLQGADADLLELEGTYFQRGGVFWVLELDGKVFGSHAAFPDPDQEGVCKFRRLYVDQSVRGTHWSTDLMQIAIDWAETQGFRRIEFWSDTRFKRAHRFFPRFGFQTDGRTRQMDDGIEPYIEYFYFLDLT